MLPCVSLFCFMVFGPPGLALDGSLTTPVPAIPVQAFGRANPQCRAWSDGCVTCEADGGSARCSLPGIACTPRPVACRDPAAP